MFLIQCRLLAALFFFFLFVFDTASYKYVWNGGTVDTDMLISTTPSFYCVLLLFTTRLLNRVAFFAVRVGGERERERNGLETLLLLRLCIFYKFLLVELNGTYAVVCAVAAQSSTVSIIFFFFYSLVPLSLTLHPFCRLCFLLFSGCTS